MKKHDLKIRPMYYRDVVSERKTFEIRKNDRGFNVGDILHLREYLEYGDKGEYTGNSCYVKVTYILTSFEAISSPYCVLSVKFMYEQPYD